MAKKEYYKDKDSIKMLGKRIQHVRKSMKVSQEELAFRCGFELSQIGRIERGTINTSISNVFAIATALNIPVKELFDFE